MGVAARAAALAALAAWMLVAGACAATIREEAERAEARIPRAAAARLLERAWSLLEGGKRLFDIRAAGRARVFNGEGAIVYGKDPLRVRLEIFGPHATPVLSLVQLGDSMAVRLPEEGKLLVGRAGDPAFALLVEDRAFTGHELLGALVGAYDVAALVRGPADTLAHAAGGELVVALLEEGRGHRFAYSAADSTLREYRQERGGRIAYRVRFSDYRGTEKGVRPFRIDLEDLVQRRTVRVDVIRETFDGGLPLEAFRPDAL